MPSINRSWIDSRNNYKAYGFSAHRLLLLVYIMLTSVTRSAWTPLRPHPQQSAIWRDTERFKVIVAGRGSGKSEIARRYVVRWLPVEKPDWSDPLYFYALPTFRQAKKVAWNKLKALTPTHWVKKIYESDLTIVTKFGSELWLLGMDKPQRAEGVQFDGGVCDESSDMKPDAINISILPTLTHRDGWLMRIGVPKRHGVGAASFKAAYDIGVAGTDPNTKSYHWPSSDILSANALAAFASKIDTKDYNEQFGANWESVGGQIFHSYSDIMNVSEQVCYNPNRPLCIGSDFNVSPMAWVIGHRGENSIEIFDEIFIKDTNTEATMDILWEKYKHHKAGFEFFGDATGRARKTSSTSSDLIIINNDARFKPKQIYYLKSNPPVVDRFAACNAMFCNAIAGVRLRINPRCVNLRKDLLSRAYKAGTREPDDKGDIGHITDALGYIVYRCFPLKLETDELAEGGII